MASGRQPSPLYEHTKSILLGLIDDEKDLKLEEVRGSASIILEVRVSHRDAGKVIGNRGQTADAIRLLLYAFAKKYGLKADVDFKVLNTRNDAGGW